MVNTRACALAVALATLAASPVACRNKPREPNGSSVFEVRLALEPSPVDRRTEKLITVESHRWRAGEVLVAAGDVITAEVVAVGQHTEVQLLLSDSAGERMKRNSPTYIGRPLLVYVHGQLVDTPTVHSILGRRIVVAGTLANWSPARMDAFAAELNSAAAPMFGK